MKISERAFTPTDITHLPKIDLHRHLLGSARPETLWRFAQKYGVTAAGQSLAEFKTAIVHRAPPQNLSRYISPWALFRDVVRDAEEIWQIAHEAAIDAREDGVKYIEFRSSPTGMPITDGTAPQTQIPADEYFQAILEGFSNTVGITCRLIASIPRHAVGMVPSVLMEKYSDRFFDLVTRFRDRLIVGVDLTGVEHGFPAGLFRPVFAEAQKLRLPVTIHAGETEGPEEIWAAIDDLGASRIGHGTSAPQDPRLVEELIKRRIVLEVSPTAGWLIGVIKNRQTHPVIGSVPSIPYVICTDNPTLNASSQSSELELASRIAGMEVESFCKWQFESALNFTFGNFALADSQIGDATQEGVGVKV